MSDIREGALDNLLQLVEKQGYVLIDDVLTEADDRNLSMADVDWLSGRLGSQGVIIYDEKPDSINYVQDDTEDLMDFAHIDYSALYTHATEMAPSLTSVIEAIKSIVPAQRNELSELLVLCSEGNQYAKQRLIDVHMRLALKRAVDFVERYDGDLSELFPEAIIGLVCGVNKYDRTKNGAIGSYLSRWIMQRLVRSVPFQNKDIYMPAHISEKYVAIYEKIKENFDFNIYSIAQFNTATKYVEDLLRCDETFAVQMVRQMIPSLSIEQIMDNEDDSDLKYLSYEEPGFFMAEERCMQGYSFDIISHAGLTPKEKEVFSKRLGMFDEKEMTLEAVGRSMGITRERVRQIESSARRKILRSEKGRQLCISLYGKKRYRELLGIEERQKDKKS